MKKNPEHTCFHELGHTLYYKTRQNYLNLYRYFKNEKDDDINEIFAEGFVSSLLSIEKRKPILYNYYKQLLHRL